MICDMQAHILAGHVLTTYVGMYVCMYVCRVPHMHMLSDPLYLCAPMSRHKTDCTSCKRHGVTSLAMEMSNYTSARHTLG